MLSLAKFRTDSIIDNFSKYLNFSRHLHKYNPMGMRELGAFHIPPKKLEVFLHHSIRSILGISMAEVKEQQVKNETARKKLFDIPNI